MTDLHSPPVFKPGDVARFGITLRDDTGIGEVFGVFARAGSPETSLVLRGNGEGAQQATVPIEVRIGERTVEGVYRCLYVQAHDVRGHYEVFRPEIAFTVDQPNVDTLGPSLEGWSFLPDEQRQG